MSTSKYIGRVGALAVALGVGFAVTVAPGGALAESPDPPDPPIDRTALIMGGATVPTPDDYLVEVIKNQYIAPTHPGKNIEYVAVTTPQQVGPITGLIRLIGIALGPQEIWGPGGPGWWADEPLWKLSGLFDLTLEQSVQAGVKDLEQAMVDHGNDHLVIYGISQGSMIATREKRKLAEQYPAGTVAPDIDFVMQATQNLPNGGLLARFPGLYLPILDWNFDGPAPTDTQFDTIVINRQYDGFADFPLFPINLFADLNALLGAAVYVHPYAWDVSLAPGPTTSPAFQGTHGDTDYYFFETQNLPLFGPLRTLGLPESVIDVFEPFFRVIVELGYDRSIKPWEPTPARLFPPLNPVKVVADLVDAIGEGVNNALSITGSQAPLTLPATSARRAVNGDTLPTTMAVQRVMENVEVEPLEQVTGNVQAKTPDQDSEIEQVPMPERGTDTDPTELKNFSISKPYKKADKPLTHRPVRDAFKAFSQHIRGVLASGDADAPPAVAPAAKDGPAQAESVSDDDPDAKDADDSE